MSKRKAIVEINASDIISGLGANVVKIMEKDGGQTICFIGMIGDEEMIWFPKPATFNQIEAVTALLQKKKFSRALSKGNTEKAQEIADKKCGKV